MSRQNETSVSMPMRQIGSDQYWRGIFNKYDRDKDGRISYAELKSIIESREYANDLPDNVVEKIMGLADRDNSGYLDFKEFIEMMHNPDLKAVFGHFVGRYIHSIIPHRKPVDTTGFKRRSVRKVMSNRVDVAKAIASTSRNHETSEREQSTQTESPRRG